MTKVTLKANELTQTNVNIVSMVKRGANRIPFRIVKEDNEEMFDLHKIAAKALVKSEDKKPGVLAVIVAKSADIAALTTLLAPTGLKLDKGEEKDGLTVFKQEGVAEFDVGMIKLDDEVCVAVSGLTKGFSSYNWQDTDFATVFATEGFYPSMRTATEAFSTTVSNILYKEETKSEISTKVTKALTDFGAIVNTLVNSIPESAIKADDLLKSEEYLTAKADKAKASPVADDKDAEAAAAKVKAKKEEDDAAAAALAKAEAAKKEDKTTEAVKTDGNADLVASIGEMIKAAMAPVTASVDALKTDLTKVTTRVEEVATTAQKTDTALRGTVLASSSPDRTVSTKKTDSEVAPPPLDTAYRDNK